MVQGLLAINGSSVGSVGKRSPGPFSFSTSPHLPKKNKVQGFASGSVGSYHVVHRTTLAPSSVVSLSVEMESRFGWERVELRSFV